MARKKERKQSALPPGTSLNREEVIGKTLKKSQQYQKASISTTTVSPSFPSPPPQIGLSGRK